MNANCCSRVADGDESAFKELLYANSDHLGAFVYKVTASREISQEIVQDVFIKIWNARASLPGIERFNQYLFILTRNLTYNYIRDQSRASPKYRQWLHEMEHQGNTENIIREEEGLARYLDKQKSTKDVAVKQRFLAPIYVKKGVYNIKCKVTFLTCNDDQCLPPRRIRWSRTLRRE